jgi:hypothetical protein
VRSPYQAGERFSGSSQSRFQLGMRVIEQCTAQRTQPLAALLALDQAQLPQAQYRGGIAVSQRSPAIQTLHEFLAGPAQVFPISHVAIIQKGISEKNGEIEAGSSIFVNHVRVEAVGDRTRKLIGEPQRRRRPAS